MEMMDIQDGSGRDSEEETEAELFEKLLDDVGSDGYYQNRFNMLFNFALITVFAMPFINYIIAMAVPDHWCYVPGREDYNLTVEQWKDIFIPRGLDGGDKYEKCKMYNLTDSQLIKLRQDFMNNNVTQNEHQLIDCQYGWEYDTTWYSNTAPSEANWVCDKELYMTQVFAVARVGDVLGTMIFGQLGDIIGRKPVFILSIAVVVIGRSAGALTTGYFPLFAMFAFMANLCANAVFQSPLAIGMEVSSKALHARINGVQYIGWTLGLSALPFIAWACSDWKAFILITSLPSGLFLLLYKIIPESPRWLAAKDRPEEAAEVLADIAKTNNRELPANSLEILKHIAEVSRRQKCYGFISLFSSPRMAFYTIILMLCWVATSICYDVLILNVNNMSGNPFLNFFYQSIMELPGYVVGMWLTEVLGRRWTHVLFLLLNCGACVCVTFLMSHFSFLAIALVMFAKFCTSLTFYTLYLQSLEIYPTCLRQTGTSAGIIMASSLGVLAPFIVYLGTSIDQRYPYACMALIAFFGAIAASFLPETLGQQLPETLAEARMFGKNQNYWGIITKIGSRKRRILVSGIES